MRAILSIPVHEKPEVINDQIKNIVKFFPEAAIVLHISASFFDKYSISEIEKNSKVYINPEHLTTSWGDIVLPHLSNFNYIPRLGIDYDYFVMHSSNDMYIRYGVSEYISRYEAGFNLKYMRQADTYWWPCHLAWEDPWLKLLMIRAGQTKIVASQVEGSFYSKEIIGKIMNVLQGSIDAGDADKKKGHYPREEFFFSTIAETLVPYTKMSNPYVFSEVHRFDGELWAFYKRFDCLYNKWGHFIISRRFYDKLKAVYNGKKFDKGGYKITAKDVDAIRSNDPKITDKYEWLDNGKSVDLIYNGTSSLYAVKRVPRDIDDKLRVYIRQLK